MAIEADQGIRMGGARTNKTSELPKKDERKKKLPPAVDEDEDYEDGDIATPKRDRYGTDDEPL
jgi:hypothetical protein